MNDIGPVAAQAPFAQALETECAKGAQADWEPALSALSALLDPVIAELARLPDQA
jgi:hypothetical protein